MRGFYPYITNDGSVGLYNEEYNDIYHSATGALTEAYEKFVLPIDFDIYSEKDKIYVLDICYGIGYNSKSFLNFIFENAKQNNKFKPGIGSIYTNKNINNYKHYIDKVYGDNKYPTENLANNRKYNVKIYSNNIFSKIYINAVDNDKILSFLSPFINSGIKNYSNKNINFKYKNIQKYIDENKKENKNEKFPKINKLINFLILDKIVNKFPDIYQNSQLNDILLNSQNKYFFNNDIMGIYGYSKQNNNSSIPIIRKLFNLHNIYYRHITNCYKKDLKTYKLQDINFNLNLTDARCFIKNDTCKYDIIFLDAFTPSKCPCLWSYDFFLQLYKHINYSGILLTYTTSASVRSAMQAVGFKIGYIKNKHNKIIGTLASKNSMLIKYPLSEFDLGLLKTKAGIFYRDENLTGQNEAIILRRDSELKNSDRISSSSYKKTKN